MYEHALIHCEVIIYKRKIIHNYNSGCAPKVHRADMKTDKYHEKQRPCAHEVVNENHMNYKNSHRIKCLMSVNNVNKSKAF